jgi:threonylcarbamoyladenosine tRNA methylthiotransferase MtaB
MIGRTLSVVTLTEGALSDNFLKVELATPRPANQLIDVRIGSLTSTGLGEHSALACLPHCQPPPSAL